MIEPLLFAEQNVTELKNLFTTLATRSTNSSEVTEAFINANKEILIEAIRAHAQISITTLEILSYNNSDSNEEEEDEYSDDEDTIVPFKSKDKELN